MNKINIAFLDRATIAAEVDIPQPSFPHHWTDYASTSLAERITRLEDVSCVLTNKVPIDADLIAHCPKLKYVGVVATGYNVVDIDACRKQGITVCNVKGYSTDSVAEHVFGFMLALRRQLKAYQASLIDGAWQRAGQFVYFHQPIIELKSSVLGLVGTGAIAQATANIAQAFGMRVLFHSPSGRLAIDGAPCVTLNDLLTQADIVSLHCPLTEQTTRLIGEAEIAQMKPTALLINTARGPIVDVDALIAALKANTIAGAGLDVLPEEPPVDESAVMKSLHLANLLVTPHTAWASSRAQQVLLNTAVDTLNQFIAGNYVENLA